MKVHHITLNQYPIWLRNASFKVIHKTYKDFIKYRIFRGLYNWGVGGTDIYILLKNISIRISIEWTNNINLKYLFW